MSAYKDRKTNNWVATFRYTDVDGKRKRKTKRGFEKKSDALEWERLFLSNLDKPKHLDVNFEEFYNIYMSDISNQLRDSTKETKNFIVKEHLIPFFGNMLLSSIKSKDIIKWQNEMLGKKLSKTYTRAINNQLHTIFNHAERYYNLTENPIHAVKPVGKSNADKIDFWTKDEFDTFIDTVDDEISKINFMVLFYTGMRMGELMGVFLEDIDFEQGHIEINRTARYKNKEFTFSKPKTSKSLRTVTIPRSLNDLLKNHVEKFYFIDHDEQVFLTTPDRLHKDMTKYSKVAGVKRIRIHDLRHSHASLLIEQGVQPNIVQDRLGHENIETTLKTYSHMYPNKQYEVAEFINDMILGKKKDDNKRSSVLISTTK